MEDNNFVLEHFSKEILREYDIRGIVDNNLTVNTAYTIGRTFGSIVFNKTIEKKICVGFDGRLSSPSLHSALCKGLVDSGVDVISIGLCPTPMLYYGIYNQKIKTGIMVTGSHNPPDYNGFKMVLDNKPFYSERIQELQSLVNVVKKNKVKGKYIETNITNDYVDRILKNISLDKKLRIAWDPGNGAVGVTINSVIKKLKNSENFVINDKVDGSFPNHHPDPTIPKNLISIQKLIKENKCDLGFAFDGDGDRLGIVDNKGQIIWADIYMIILAEEISKKYTNAPIIMDVKSSKVFFDEVKKMGCNPIMYRTGHSVIKDKMIKIDSPLSGELSGHVMYKDDFYGFDDAMYVGLRFLRIISQKNESLNEIIALFPKTFSTPEIRIDVDESRKFKIIEEIKIRQNKKGINIETIDGLRVNLRDGWWGIRASNTQNALTIRVEAKDQKILNEMLLNIEKELKVSEIDFKFSS